MKNELLNIRYLKRQVKELNKSMKKPLKQMMIFCKKYGTKTKIGEK